MGVLCPESWAKGVDIAQGAGVVLDRELAGHCQTCLFLEKVILIVDDISLDFLSADLLGLHRNLAFLVFAVDNGCYLEHLSSSFTVAGCDDWSVDIYESELLEELVRGHGQRVPCSGHGWNQVGPWPQMKMLPEQLQRGPFAGQNIIIRTHVSPQDLDLVLLAIDYHLNWLLVFRRLDEETLDLEAGRRSLLLNLLEARVSLLNYYLKILVTGAIREANKD